MANATEQQYHNLSVVHPRRRVQTGHDFNWRYMYHKWLLNITMMHECRFHAQMSTAGQQYHATLERLITTQSAIECHVVMRYLRAAS